MIFDDNLENVLESKYFTIQFYTFVACLENPLSLKKIHLTAARNEPVDSLAHNFMKNRPNSTAKSGNSAINDQSQSSKPIRFRFV